MNSFKLDDINFESEELDYESNGGNPFIVSSFSGIQLLDSYLNEKGKIYKLYKPGQNNILVNYSISLILVRAKISRINSLIFKQTDIVKNYRSNYDTDELKGFNFSWNPTNSDKISGFCWITGFTINGTYYDIENNIEKTRCKLDIQDAE